MKKEQGFSLIELLIVVAIIAIIAAIAIPNMLTARMAANETSSIANLRAYSSAQVAYSIQNSQQYALLANLANAQLDARWATAAVAGFSGYTYAEEQAGLPGASTATPPIACTTPGGYSALSAPKTLNSTGRYSYGVASDGVIRWIAGAPTPVNSANAAMTSGDPIGS